MRKLIDVPVEIKTKFQPKKKLSKKLSRVYKRIGLEKKYKRVNECGNYFEYSVFSDNTANLTMCNFCKDMLGPMCAWRKELKMFNQVSKIVDVLERQKYNFVFVTLTVRNCENDIEALKAVINEFNKAYVKLCRLQRIKRILKGAFRAIEITYNKQKDELHPHIHLIWVVPKGYFQSEDYLKQKELCELWKQSLGIDYTPICDIRVVTGKKLIKDGKIVSYDLKSAVAEVCKYAIKSVDYLNNSDEVNEKVVKTLVGALAHRRLVTFYGVFAEARKQLDFDDIDDGDLLHVGDEKTNAELLYRMCFKWNNRTSTYVHTNVIINIDSLNVELRRCNKEA